MIIKNSHFNVLIGLNSFILFFILFEKSIQIPAFLQVFGRMHPLLLHFPIVLLILSWLLYLFRRPLEKEIPNASRFINLLFYVSALTIAITAIFGLLLSKEGGFEGEAYLWHKYSGVGLSFLTLGLIAFIRFNISSKNRLLFTVGINLSFILLLIVGHFGATLTHGEDFVFAPMREKKSTELNIENAMVFEDAVLPILQAKCAGCHNADKAKGGLILTDSSSILKGGENGKVFIAGNALTSLMIERILMDIDNEHRMPPKGKPQLSIDEVSLLRSWIQRGGKFDVPLSAFREQDTLFQSVKAVYGFEGTEKYDFSPANEEKIAELNTPYRIINSVDHGSPALDVNFYGKDFYTKESLSELLPIAEQIVSLNLSSMPVSKEDLQTLKKFKNLRILNLNNTQLSNEDLSQIDDLKNLKSLSLIGTQIKLDGLHKIVDLPSIRKLYVWNTAIQPKELEQIRKENPKINIDAGIPQDDSQKLALTAPKITPNRSFFQNKTLVSLSHPIPGVSLRYTLDGSDPDSSGAQIYKSSITIDKNALLRVKADKEGWLKSPEVKQNFYIAIFKPERINLETRPHQQYKARKGESFFDLESGSDNNADGRWLGFQGSDMSTILSFDKPVKMDTVALSIKQDYNQHIYPPESIEIWAGLDSLNLKLLKKVNLTLEKPDKIKNRRIIACDIPRQEVSFIRLKTKPYAKIPEGFPGNGNLPWLFVDEIILK